LRFLDFPAVFAMLATAGDCNCIMRNSARYYFVVNNVGKNKEKSSEPIGPYRSSILGGVFVRTYREVWQRR